jgi:hypothetical protein
MNVWGVANGKLTFGRSDAHNFVMSSGCWVRPVMPIGVGDGGRADPLQTKARELQEVSGCRRARV